MPVAFPKPSSRNERNLTLTVSVITQTVRFEARRNVIILFAEFDRSPGGIIAWLVVGLIAGWLAGVVMKGGGHNIAWEIIIGLVGALIGGIVFRLLMAGEVCFWGSIVVAFIGACILIAIVRATAPGLSAAR